MADRGLLATHEIAAGRAREKALALLADDLVEEDLVPVMALVRGYEAPFRDLRGVETQPRG